MFTFNLFIIFFFFVCSFILGSGSRGGAGSSSSRGQPSGSGGGGDERSSRSMDGSQSDLNEQIIVTLLRLQRDMSGVLNRLNSLEALVKEGKMVRESLNIDYCA